MTELPLPALDGRTPLGFLAALSVLRLVTEHTSHHARLAWTPEDATAVLHDAQPNLDVLIADHPAPSTAPTSVPPITPPPTTSTRARASTCSDIAASVPSCRTAA